MSFKSGLKLLLRRTAQPPIPHSRLPGSLRLRDLKDLKGMFLYNGLQSWNATLFRTIDDFTHYHNGAIALRVG